MQRTTIALSPRTRDRLTRYGRKGMSYEQILERLMDAVSPGQLSTDPEPPPFARRMARSEVEVWRGKSAAEKLAVAEEMRRLAVKVNPEGVRRLAQSRSGSRRRSSG